MKTTIAFVNSFNSRILLGATALAASLLSVENAAAQAAPSSVAGLRNSNPYNQDNETTWLDWALLEKNRDIFQFFQRMIAFRKTHPAIAPGRYWRESVHWYGATGPVDFESRCLAYCLRGASDLYVMINAFWEPMRFQIQQPGAWNCVVDTSRADFAARAVEGWNYEVAPRSVVVLERAG